ncbi:MAG: hypothetical protein ACM3Y9_12470 [Ignavibacteria bacterium]
MNIRNALIVPLALASALAAAEDPMLPDALTIGWINAPDVYAHMAYCSPGIRPETVADIQSRAAKATIVFGSTTADRTPYLLASADRFTCIERNGRGKPLLPPALFGKFLKLEGASAKTAEALQKNLATQIATRGAADALVKFGNGNGLEITLLVAEDSPSDIYFSTNFVKAGQYDETKYRFVAADQITSFATTSWGSSGRRIPILQNELAPRPMKGSHLAVAGTPETGAYAFDNSRWKFNTDAVLLLGPDGAVSFTPKKGDATSGTWRKEDNAVYFNYGKIFGSGVLDKDGNLFVEFRGPAISSGDPERRWTATLTKTGFF